MINLAIVWNGSACLRCVWPGARWGPARVHNSANHTSRRALPHYWPIGHLVRLGEWKWNWIRTEEVWTPKSDETEEKQRRSSSEDWTARIKREGVWSRSSRVTLSVGQLWSLFFSFFFFAFFAFCVRFRATATAFAPDLLYIQAMWKVKHMKNQ